MEPYKEREREYQAVIAAKHSEVEKRDIEIAIIKESQEALKGQISDLQQ
jgi:hypothetical protein